MPPLAAGIDCRMYGGTVNLPSATGAKQMKVALADIVVLPPPIETYVPGIPPVHVTVTP